MKIIFLLSIIFFNITVFADTSRHDKFLGTTLNIDNIQIDGNTISSTSGNIILNPTTELEITTFGTYKISDLMPASFSTQIPAFVIDGASTAAKAVFAGGILYNGTGNESIFLIATKDIPAGAAEFSADLVLMVGGDASSGGGVGAMQFIVNEHTGPSGSGGNMLLRVHESINGTSGKLELRMDAGVGFKISHQDSQGIIGECLVSTSISGDANWDTCPGAGGATTALDNLASVQINTDLQFDTEFAYEVGGSLEPASTMYAQDYQVLTTGPDLVMNISGGLNATTPAGTDTNAIIECLTDNLTGPCAFFTTNNGDVDAAPTANVEIATGNKLAGTGDGGDIINYLGTSVGGARGGLFFIDGTEGTNGECWVSTGVLGQGNWDTCPGGGGADTDLNNLIATSINQDLDPSTTNARDLGNNSAHWKRLAVNTIQLVKSGTLFGFIDADTSVVMPSGKTVNVALINSTASADHGVAVHTINTSSATVDSGDVFIETGNQTINSVVTRKSGDLELKTGNVTGANNLGGSGGLKLETGTVTGSGARGKITADSNLLDVLSGAAFKKVTADPCGDTVAFPEATLFYNDTSDYYCFCDGAGVDVQMHSPATACF